MSQVKKLHNIIDKDNNQEVGYTVEGVLGRLLVYLYKNGDKNKEELHGETHNFNYYCIMHGWNFKLEDYVEPVVSTPTKSSINQKLSDSIDSVIDFAIAYKMLSGVAITEQDLVDVLNEEFVDRGIIHNLKCFSLLTRSYPVGNTIQTEVYTKILMVTRPDDVKALKVDLLSNSEIINVTYDNYSSVCNLDFVIVY